MVIIHSQSVRWTHLNTAHSQSYISLSLPLASALCGLTLLTSELFATASSFFSLTLPSIYIFMSPPANIEIDQISIPQPVVSCSFILFTVSVRPIGEALGQEAVMCLSVFLSSGNDVRGFRQSTAKAMSMEISSSAIKHPGPTS